VVFGLAALLIAGCSATESALAPPSQQISGAAHGTPGLPPALVVRMGGPAGSLPAVRPKRSWMSPDAKRAKSLLYTSNAFNNEVDVYGVSGKNNNLLGQLTGFNEPYGECADKSSNVYVTNYLAQSVVEYAHGGTSPINTLSDSYGNPVGCAVSPKTGDLAVINLLGGASGYGSLVIYAGTTGNGTMYSVGAAALAWPPVYDKSGDLFFETENDTTHQTYLLEFPNNSSAVETISLPASVTIYSPSGTTWDGKHVGVSDEEYEGGNTEGIYRVSISGSAATVVGQADYTDDCFDNSTLVVQPIVYKGMMIGGNFACYYDSLYEVDFWSYKKGGNPVRYINGSATLNTSWGQTISKRP
jgi:hypothetical protein